MSNTIGSATPETYNAQLEEKIELTKYEFDQYLKGINLEVYPSPKMHFRMRAEFRIWHQDDKAHYAMYEPGKYKQPVLIDNFSIGSQKICETMPHLLNEINASSELRQRLFQVEFLSTLSGDLLITLIYHKSLDEAWVIEATKLEKTIGAYIIGRSRKQKRVITQDYVTEILPLSIGEIHYQQIETGFTQPNAMICISMLNWSVEHSKDLGGDLIELYCGNGNFTIPLSYNFDKVIATEISKLSTRAATHNKKINGRKNIDLVRLSAEEACEAIAKKREFRRLSHINIDDFNFSTIFVDPPRAGLDSDTLDFASRFENIIYISCNPETLKSNLDYLNRSHQVSKFALFDQFPYTHHRECGVILRRSNT